ncbi:EamA family transporter RarD [Halomonas sp. McH1-25]|uniref:EamA family transporter RarD n=1 Tax=unclassified Halomonas TaxID=2609666 RepID=UPI001EF5CF2D|nr:MULTISPECIES: EamA family transporter RarD [unclassified Halomonas]MCG7598327.1 EamA family transporter RarD [Halomonas sp. McH1-25]MCP1340890.1 EamA family transporter RarD [Halomonas sp. FL8]MCP1361613.1 EamA family transporter RarD [Halomonas sp. BBD45]MCP1365002.1 EamA family transporter RarD [Halomonas sp. BBD48]
MASPASADKQATQGVIFGLTAYVMWGCFPLFFALFEGIPAWEVLIHRILWSCVFLAGLISVLRRWTPVSAALAQPRRLGRVLACALLIGLNWGIYIYAVETRHVFQASLGYFLTPLVNVLLGMIVLKERMERLQGIAVGLATVAIAIQLILLGELPWITLTLAISFGTYGLLRKQIPLDGLSGLFVETLLLLPLGLVAIVWLSAVGGSHFFAGDGQATLLLISSGIITALPLMAFAGAARRLRLATVGFLMYINPTLQFFIALLVFREPLAPTQLASFLLIWIGLALYSYSAWQSRPRKRSVPESA